VDEKTEALWRAAAESTYDKIRGKIIPAESFDEARKVLTEYRKQKASTGSR
jgi:hypothetical protein